jgi:methylmalonyl-CoA mutase N-terminal domain/subunit
MTADPLAGSYYVEHLTNELERHALELLAKVDELGGAAKAIAASFFQEEIGRSAYEYQMRVESGDAVIVGVNKFSDGKEPPLIAAPDFSALERDQVARVRAVRKARDESLVQSCLAKLADASRAYAGSGPREPIMDLIVDAVRARASVGEIADTLRGTWGVYRPT